MRGMPYKVEQDGEDWMVVNTELDKIVARHMPPDAKEKAEKQVRLLEAVEHDPGWKPTEKKSEGENDG